MAKRVVIVGGGISGLLINYVMSKCSDVECTLLEPGPLGGEFLSGGLKYIHRTDEFANMLDELDIVWSDYAVRGGIMLHGNVEHYPRHLQTMDKSRADRIRYDHFKKTRRIEPGTFGAKAMNDPESDRAKAIRCDFQELISKLGALANVKASRLDRIEPKFVTSNGGATYWYDYLFLTIPLWVIQSAAYFQVPSAAALRLNICQVEPLKDHYSKWDYVYTPYTPADAIHRISSHEGGYSCEVNGQFDLTSFLSDLSFLFPEGWTIKALKEGLKGHLLPLPSPLALPGNIATIGRFASWDPRSTSDVVLSEAQTAAKNWGLL